MSEAQKRKKSFYKGKYGGKKGRYDNELRPKIKGFILTCNGQERSATLEGYRILNEYADKRYGPEEKEPTNDSDDAEDIEAALKEEISSIKAKSKSKERRFQTVSNKAKNVLFIKTAAEIEPALLVKDIFEDLSATGEAKTKYCCKLLPVEDTCYAKVDQIVAMAKPLIQKFFTENEKPFTYCIMWKTRCNSNIKRDNVYADLVQMIKGIDSSHSVSYDTPDVTLNIDIIGNICCFGFLRDYHKNGKYNMDTITKKNVDWVIKDEIVEKTNGKMESKDAEQLEVKEGEIVKEEEIVKGEIVKEEIVKEGEIVKEEIVKEGEIVKEEIVKEGEIVKEEIVKEEEVNKEESIKVPEQITNEKLKNDNADAESVKVPEVSEE